MESKNVLRAKVINGNVKESIVIKYNNDITAYVDIDAMKTPLDYLLYDFISSNYYEWEVLLIRKFTRLMDNMLHTSDKDNVYVDLNGASIVDPKRKEI